MRDTTATTRRTQIFRGDSGTALGTRARNDSGYIFAMMGLLMIPIVIMMAFSMDLGSWYAQGQKMQRAADAASLAGVVWANDSTQWDTVARATATKNGYTDGVNGVSVDVSKLASNQVKVTIGQDGAQYFSTLVFPNGERLNRRSTAEYVLPVPLGSPRNYLGTGGLGKGAVNTAYEPERLWDAVSGYCTDRYQGDLVASKYYDSDTSNACTGGTNPGVEGHQLRVLRRVAGGSTYGDRHTHLPRQLRTEQRLQWQPERQHTERVLPCGQHEQQAVDADDLHPLQSRRHPPRRQRQPDDGVSRARARPVPARARRPSTRLRRSPRAAESNYDFNPDSTKFTDTGSTATAAGTASARSRRTLRPASTSCGCATRTRRRARRRRTTARTPSASSPRPSSPQRLCDARTDRTARRCTPRTSCRSTPCPTARPTSSSPRSAPSTPARRSPSASGTRVRAPRELRIKKPDGHEHLDRSDVQLHVECAPLEHGRSVRQQCDVHHERWCRPALQRLPAEHHASRCRRTTARRPTTSGGASTTSTTQVRPTARPGR